MVNYDDWRKAGQIAAKAREYTASLVKENGKMIDVVEKVEKYIEKLGGKQGFPSPQLSINNIAAHYIAFPNDETVFKKGDVVKVDCGVHVNGCVGDNATTVEVMNNKYSKLIKSVNDARDNAVKEVKAGAKVCEIGRIIEDTIKGQGFIPIRNLSGHNILPYVVHGGLTVPNYNNKDNTKLEEGMIIAIEPFAIESGDGLVKEGKPSSIYRLNSEKSVRDAFQREIISFLWKEYKTLPFCTRNLAAKFPLSRLQIALAMLERQGIVYQYPQLPEKSGAIVVQAENSMIVHHDHAEVITKV